VTRIATPPVSRRTFLASAGALGAAGWLMPRELFGAPALRTFLSGGDGPVQQLRRAAAKDPVRVQRLRGNMSLLTGSGGNIAALSGPDGVLLVDSGIVGAKVAAAVATVTRAPIRHVVNTHWHFDHTDANAWLHERGAGITAHANTRRRLSADTRVDDWDFTFPQSPAGALPATTVSGERTIEVDGSRIVLRPFAPAHTDSDISVHLVDADVLHLGDVYWNGVYPFIDYSTGGSIGGTIRAAEESLALASARTLIVPGHGPAGDRTALARYRDTLATIRDRVAALKRRGQTVVEVVAAKPTARFDAAMSGGPLGPDFFTRLLYKGV